jgi:hypothetical protein
MNEWIMYASVLVLGTSLLSAETEATGHAVGAAYRDTNETEFGSLDACFEAWLSLG